MPDPTEPDELQIVRGLIGWSNHRSGCEFYEDLPAPRWDKRESRRAAFGPDEPTGRLLTDALDDPEGAEVIVVVLPRSSSESRHLIQQKITAALASPTEQEKK